MIQPVMEKMKIEEVLSLALKQISQRRQIQERESMFALLDQIDSVDRLLKIALSQIDALNKLVISFPKEKEPEAEKKAGAV